MPGNHPDQAKINLLVSSGWSDYELLDSGGGAKLERYGPYTFERPEHQAIWQRALPQERWQTAHAFFEPTGEESGGRWQFNRPVKTPWQMSYQGLRFISFTASSRHMGVFPEQTVNWDWIGERIREHSSRSPAKQPDTPKVLNLFGYTGLATLAAAQAGAQVTHVDASKKAILLARENQTLSGLEERPIRWLVDDAVQIRET